MSIIHGHPLDIEKLTKELGDILWYIAQACYSVQVPMDTVAVENIEKLRNRYPSGFSAEKSLNRSE